MTAISRFEFPVTSQPVRTISIDGDPWFVLADVAKILGYRDAEHASRLLRDHQFNTLPQGIAAELGQRGGRAPTIATEGGLYRLVIRSNVAMAEQFQDWVTDEVLPAIRRTGSYGAERYELPHTLPEALRAYAAEVEAHEVTRAALEEAAPAADAWQVLASSDPDYSVREAAYILNRDPAIDTGQNRLFNELRRLRVIDSQDIPYSGHARHVKLRPRSFTNRATNEEMPAKPQVRITADGLAYLHRKLGGSQPLQLDAIGGA